MRKQLYLLLLFTFPSMLMGWGQRALSLEECLEIALENNLQLQQAEISRDIAGVNYTQSKYNFLPNLNAFANLNKGIGTQVDNFTQQIAQSPTTFSPGFSTSVTLFNGFVNWNTLKAREYDAVAAQYSVEAIKNTVRLNVVLAYFQVMFDQENLKISANRQEILSKQLEKLEKQLGVGLITEDALLNLRAQLSTESVNQINAQNQLDKDKLNLMQYLEIQDEGDFDVQTPREVALSESDLPADIDEIFKTAMATLPEVREKQMRILSAKYGVKNAKAAFLPTVTASFGAGSFFSSNARELLGFNTSTFSPIYGETTPFFTQVGDNFGSQITFSLNVPIFNRYQARAGYETSKFQLANTELDLKIQKNTIYKQIQQAALDVRASRAKYLATQAQLESLTASHTYAKSKYDIGVLDFYSYVEILNNKTNAETELVSAKYDYLLKSKILDIYQGKPLVY